MRLTKSCGGLSSGAIFEGEKKKRGKLKSAIGEFGEFDEFDLSCLDTKLLFCLC